MAMAPAPTRSARFSLLRLFRFRLLTLLIVVTLIAVWLAWRFHREPISAANVAQLQRLSEIKAPAIFKLVYSPDRSRVAFVGWETPVQIREAVTFWPLGVEGPDRKLIQFAFSPDGDHVALCENNTRAEIISRRQNRRFILETDDSQPDVVFSPDGKLLATGGYTNAPKLWNVATGKFVRAFNRGGGRSGTTPVFSPDSKILAIGDRNARTTLFSVATGKQLLTLPKRETQELMFHPSGKQLAVAYCDGMVRLWEVPTGKLIAEQDSEAEEIYTLDWSPDGQLLATAGLNGDISIWDGQLIRLHRLPAPEWCISVKFSPDGTRLITAGGSGTDREQRSVTVWGIPPGLPRFLAR
jgi:WD40 repeat protein